MPNSDFICGDCPHFWGVHGCDRQNRDLPCIHNVEPEKPKPSGRPMRVVRNTIYFCMECGAIYEGSGLPAALPCGHSRFTYYAPPELCDMLRVNREAFRVLRTCEDRPDAPQCRAVEKALDALLVATSIPDNCL